MNLRIIAKLNSRILAIVAAFMLPSVILCFIDGDVKGGVSFIISMLIMFVVSGILALLSKNADNKLRAREGFVGVGIAWLLMSALGCLPFCISGQIPKYIDALFEMVSGFTTTGSSILTDVEALTRGMLWWRSFSHWLGGMGILVLVLAIIPAGGKEGGFSLNFLRAESPGPEVGKLVPKIQKTAKILYLIYFGLTASDIILLIITGMPVFDAFCIGVGTAGTGGFGVLNSSLGSYPAAQQWVTIVFMYLFGVNFSCYYLLLRKKFKAFALDEELRAYVLTILISVTIITINLSVHGYFTNTGETVRHAAFQVGAVLTTTGFSTTDFNAWPELSKMIMLMLMFVGASAGSTGGGFKFARVLILIKALRRNFHNLTHPNEIRVVRFNRSPVEEKTVSNVYAYLAAYVFILIVSILIVSIDNKSMITNISSVTATLNNIGPGFDAVGPTSNFSDFSVLSKIVFILDMLIGRLEIFPILVLFSKSTWMAGKDKLKDKSSGRENANIAKLKTANYKTK